MNKALPSDEQMSNARAKLHDAAGQTLTSLGVQLDLLRLDYPHVEGLSDRVKQIQTTLQQAMDEVKDVMKVLAP